MHFMTEEQFAWNKARWDSIKHEINNPESFDQGIVDALKLINEIPELVTVFSCQGHPKPNVKPPDLGYIMIGVKNQAGVDKLMLFYSALGNKFDKHRHMIRLTITERTDLRFIDSDDPALKQAWWNVWNISWPVFPGNPNSYYKKVNEAAYTTVY